MRGQAAPVTAPYSFIGNRKLTKEEGEDSVVVKHQEGYAIEIYRNITVLTLSDTITVWRIVAVVLLFLFFFFSFLFFFLLSLELIVVYYHIYKKDAFISRC